MPNTKRQPSHVEDRPRPDVPLTDLARIIRAEYLEIPGLRLTKPQVQRLWGLDAPACDALLGALVDVRFLRRTEGDCYVLADAG